MSRTDAYCRYYKQQRGGEMPFYRGGQHGAGLGDILRTVWRWVAPLALRGLSAFTAKTAEAHDKGASLLDAAKGAIGPSLGAMFTPRRTEQSGSGPSALFAGVDGIPLHAPSAYKSRGAKRKKQAKLSVKAAKRILSKRQHSADFSEPGYNF